MYASVQGVKLIRASGSRRSSSRLPSPILPGVSHQPHPDKRPLRQGSHGDYLRTAVVYVSSSHCFFVFRCMTIILTRYSIAVPTFYYCLEVAIKRYPRLFLGHFTVYHSRVSASCSPTPRGQPPVLLHCFE